MAAYTGDLIDVTTPDGRRVKLPSDLAANFQGLSPVAQPTPVAAPVEAPVPVASPAPVEQVPVTAPAVSPVAVQSAPEPVAPPRLEAPVSVGNVDVYNAEQAAIANKEAAIAEQAKVDADEAILAAQELDARNAKTDEILAAQEKAAADFEAKHSAKMIEYEAEAKKLRETKIDRSVDNPILAAIGVALSGIGAAVAGRSDNPALDMLFKSIDRKVNAQLQDLDLGRQALSDRRADLASSAAAHKERLAAFDVRRIAEIDRTKAKIEAIAMRTQAPRAKANAVAAIAKLDEERAKSLSGLADRERAEMLAERERADAILRHKQSLSVQYAQMAQSQRNSDREFAESVRRFDLQRQDDINATLAKAGAAQQASIVEALKTNEERAIRDPATGRFLLQPQGEKIMSAADAIDSEAKAAMKAASKEKDPAKQAAALAAASEKMQRASAMRMEAEQYAVRAGNTGEREKIYNVLSGTQTAVSTIDDIIDLRRKHGAKWLAQTEADQAMQSKMAILALQVKEAFSLGALDAGSIQYLDKMTGGDPTKIRVSDVTSMIESAKGTEGSLNALAESLERNARNRLSGVMSGADRLSFRRATIAPKTEVEKIGADLLRERTPAELAAGERKTGTLGRLADYAYDKVLTPLNDTSSGNRPSAGSESSEARRMRAQAERGDEYGLSEKQRALTDTLIAGYKRDAESTKGKQAAGILVGAASDASRPQQARSILMRLEATAPDLAEQALARMPKTLRDEIEREREVVRSVKLPAGLQQVVERSSAARP